MALRIQIRQGARGKYRWFLYEDGKFAGMSTIRGYDTKRQAFEAAERHFGGNVMMLDDTSQYEEEHRNVYAGARDWSD